MYLFWISFNFGITYNFFFSIQPIQIDVSQHYLCPILNNCALYYVTPPITISCETNFRFKLTIIL